MIFAKNYTECQKKKKKIQKGIFVTMRDTEAAAEDGQGIISF